MLSRPAIFLGTQRILPPKGKTSALLYYLAYQNDWVSRDDVLYLFWSDIEEQKARANLRQLLSSLKKWSYLDELEITPNQVRWVAETDVQQFHHAIAKDNWAEVAAVYQGELLQGFQVSSLPEFENWLELERQHLLRIFKDTALKVAEDFMHSEHYRNAAEVLRTVLEHDPFDEISFRHYLKAVFLAEGQDRAKQALARYQHDLARELASEPEAATFKLFEDLARLTEDKSTVAVSLKTVDSKPLHNLPIKLTPFVGRKKERDELTERLTDPRVRLLTIVAPGGMGKTRLAISVAEEEIGRFADGICFIPFETLENPHNIVFQIAEGLDFKFSGKTEPKQQLFNYLKEKEMLLVTDNLEHLLEGVTVLSELLENAPASKVLATSREILNLQAEHVYELGGLQRNTTAAESDAVRLFVQSAKQRDKTFELTDNNLTLVNKICEQVAGMPLALELAASWLRALSVEDIVEELEQSIDILESQVRDRSDRQQNIRAIFDNSWLLLTEREQDALAKLAVFQGGFDRKAAKDVTQVSVPVLLGLCNKSFIRKEADGRYMQHPLLWQYAREKFEARSDKEALTQQHSTYFLTFVAQLPDVKRIIAPIASIEAIVRDYINIEIAWHRATTHPHESLLGEAAYNLVNFFEYTNRLESGKRLFQQALNVMRSESIHHGNLTFALGHTQGMSGDHQEAIVNLQKSIALFKHLNSPLLEERLRALISLAIVLGVSGQQEQAMDALRECLHLAKGVRNDFYHGSALSFMAWQPPNKPHEKIAMFRQSISLLEQSQHYSALSWAQKNFASSIMRHLGSYDDALELIETATISEMKRGWNARLTSFLVDKADIYLALGRLGEAEDYARQVLEITKELEFSFNLWSIDLAHFALAKAAKLKADRAAARTHLNAAFQVLEKRKHLGGVHIEYFIKYACEAGQLALIEKDLDTAKHYRNRVTDLLSQSSATHAPENMDRLYVLDADIALKQGDIKEARLHIKEAFNVIDENEELPNLLNLFTKYAAVLIREENLSLAASYLQCAVRHSASDFETKQDAKKMLHELKQLSIQDLDVDVLCEHIKAM